MNLKVLQKQITPWPNDLRRPCVV